jgi:hypothetical protein
MLATLAAAFGLAASAVLFAERATIFARQGQAADLPVIPWQPDEGDSARRLLAAVDLARRSDLKPVRLMLVSLVADAALNSFKSELEQAAQTLGMAVGRTAEADLLIEKLDGMAITPDRAAEAVGVIVSDAAALPRAGNLAQFFTASGLRMAAIASLRP